jgi:carbamoyl-phosphate synthase large subunit
VSQTDPHILVAGVGGASLGTEVIKCLQAAGGYRVFGCDIAPLAYGRFVPGVTAAVVRRDHYVHDVLALCRRWGIRAIVPGGEQPLGLLAAATEPLTSEGVVLATNNPGVVALCSDKSRLFDRLAELKLPLPRTVWLDDASQVGRLDQAAFPCVVKPATGTGGSRFVFLARDRDEALLYAHYILRHAGRALVQEYIPLDEGEFTIGVLSGADGAVLCVVSMKRLFHTKLSVSVQTSFGLISSGYSQGLIDHFPDLARQAGELARAIGSTGPINIQARVRDGVLVPFEINPRFSASSYLRAMAGVNEIDLFLRERLGTGKTVVGPLRPGYYLRSLAEVFVPLESARVSGFSSRVEEAPMRDTKHETPNPGPEA